MNLNKEIRDGYTVSEQMKEVWAIQMDMAKHVLDVCEKYNLRIWADGGTLLGVIRHQGFIPWDDDIDMAMLRKDYDILISLAEKEFKSPYFLQCAYTDEEYYRGHIQIRYDGTTAILNGEINRKYNLGIFLDIFCYDSFPDVVDDKWNKAFARAQKIQKMLNYRYLNFSLYSLVSPKFYLRALMYKMITTIKGPLKLFQEFEDIYRSYELENTQSVSSQSFLPHIMDRLMRKKEWYKETIWMPFEDMLMPVPVDYDEILKRHYGPNYMTPQKAPSFHGGFLVLDPHKSYKDYLPLLKKEYRRDIWCNFLKAAFRKIKHTFCFKC